MLTLLPKPVYAVLFMLLGIVYITGLFVPLMNNDAAHHADIALHMYLTNDYVNLIDNHTPYLDKPHLLFWLVALSYKLWGVNSFAYRFPSLLFTMLGVYSVYRLGNSLYNKEVGRLAALIIASAFAFILANTDVRMDAILTACIAFSMWQLVAFVQTKRIINVIGAAVGLAAGFCTKGHIALFTPAVALLFYLLYLKQWKALLSWKWALMIVLFAALIAPVVYCYYLQFNLHPQLVVRGNDHVNGVKFILLQQTAERFSGEMGIKAGNDYLFFIHSFIWAFAPWSIISFIAFINSTSTFRRREREWLTSGLFMTMLVLISLSHFKLPHYLNITFPAAAVMTAAFIMDKKDDVVWAKRLYKLQLGVAAILLLLSIFVNGWAFPVHSIMVFVVALLLLAIGIYFIQSHQFALLQKTILVSVISVTLTFFLLNTNFYPTLLTYQGGNQLALETKGKISSDKVYLWKKSDAYSWDFYTSSLTTYLTDSVFVPSTGIWILSSEEEVKDIQNAGYNIGKQYSTPDYRVSRLKFSFINPKTRATKCSKLVLSEVTGRKRG